VRLCSIDECESKSVCKGYCDVHYQRLRRRGTIHILSQYEKFMGKLKINVETDCWDWQGCCMKLNSYGVINENKTQHLTHRYSYLKHAGQIPDGRVVMHTCDRPICCNPAHLKLGTQKENLSDMYKKGRNKARVGEKNRKAILKEGQVIEIRRLARQGVKAPELAKKFNVRTEVIYKVKNNITWKHLTEDKK